MKICRSFQKDGVFRKLPFFKNRLESEIFVILLKMIDISKTVVFFKSYHSLRIV